MPMTYQQFQHSPNLFGDCEAYGEAYGGACMGLTYGCAFVEEEFLHPQFIINSQQSQILGYKRKVPMLTCSQLMTCSKKHKKGARGSTEEDNNTCKCTKISLCLY